MKKPLTRILVTPTAEPVQDDARQANALQTATVIKVNKNSAGQLSLQDGNGNPFDMSKFVGRSFNLISEEVASS